MTGYKDYLISFFERSMYNDSSWIMIRFQRGGDIMRIQKLAAALAAILSVTLLAGSLSVAAADEVTTIHVANAAMPKPYSYLGDDGEVTGYDIEVIKAIFDRLPQYELDLEVTEFSSILTGIDAGRYDLGINCLKSTEERKEKYLFSDPYLLDRNVVVVREDNDEIQSLADFAGKSVVDLTGTIGVTQMENYNARTGADIKINYSEADYSVLLTELEDGKYDFMYLNKLTFDTLNAEKPYALKTFFLTLEDQAEFADGADIESTYILASKTDEGQALIDDVNGALKSLIEDGTLNGFAEEYFGSTDYVPVLDAAAETEAE